jgi:plastocyanin
VTVSISNYQFEPKELTIEPGTVVVWKNNAGRHTVTADDKGFESPTLAAGEEFRRTFEREGRFRYYCSLHGATGGRDMAGTIIVAAVNKP